MLCHGVLKRWTSLSVIRVFFWGGAFICFKYGGWAWWLIFIFIPLGRLRQKEGLHSEFQTCLLQHETLCQRNNSKSEGEGKWKTCSQQGRSSGLHRHPLTASPLKSTGTRGVYIVPPTGRFSRQHPLSHSCCLSYLSHMTRLLAGVERLPAIAEKPC